MVRINLLPREVIEKRGFERNVKYVLVAGIAALLVTGAVYAVLAFQVGTRNTDLQDRQQLEQSLRAQAESFAIFEEKETDLEARMALAEGALAGRISWGRFANELSLVLPSDVWMVSLNCDEAAGVNMLARAVDSDSDAPDLGHKAVARTLVRLADLEQLYNVWLTSSVKSDFEEQPVIDFNVTTSVSEPGQDVVPEDEER